MLCVCRVYSVVKCYTNCRLSCMDIRGIRAPSQSPSRRGMSQEALADEECGPHLYRRWNAAQCQHHDGEKLANVAWKPAFCPNARFDRGAQNANAIPHSRAHPWISAIQRLPGSTEPFAAPSDATSQRLPARRRARRCQGWWCPSAIRRQVAAPAVSVVISKT
jgi:hypothetical protein